MAASLKFSIRPGRVPGQRRRPDGVASDGAETGLGGAFPAR
jgi:hypothetical protein